MTDVSSRILLDHLDFMQLKGIPAEPFFAFLKSELEVSPETDPVFLMTPSNWFSWDTFATMCRYWETVYGEGFEREFAEWSMSKPVRWLSAARPILRLITTPKHLYWLVHTWGGPTNFRSVRSEFSILPNRQIRIHVMLGVDDVPIPMFFRITTIALASLPRLIGHQDAVVDAEPLGTGMIYMILPPPSLSVWAQTVRHAKALFAVRSMTNELVLRDDQLRQSYLKLMRARTDLETKVAERTRALELANRELSEGIAALRTAEKIAHIGRWEWDLRTDLLVWSDETYRIFQIANDGSALSMAQVAASIHPDDLPLLRAARMKAVADRQPLFLQHRIVCPDGETRYVTQRGELLFDKDGQPYRMVGTVYDVTLQRQFESTLIAAKEAADTSNQVKSTFLANMSHEIRTPMSSVLGFAELLAMPNVAEDRRQPYAEKILRNGRHLLRLIDDALDLAKIESGRLSIAVASCSPTWEIQQAIELLKDQATAKSLNLKLELELPLPDEMHTDVTRLRQVLLNVIGNALKFTPRGQVKVNVCHVGAHLQISVRDSGPGIAASDRNFLFKPFSQIPDAPKNAGSGLGLALARRLACALGGDIVLAESTPGKGCLFVISVLVSMPVDSQHDDAALSPILRQVVDLPKGLRVLVVEDTLDIQDLLRRTLENAGAQVAVASDGKEGVDLANSQYFDIILLDMHMPNVNGYEAASRLRSAGYTAPIIALTAFAMTQDREKCFSVGCNDFLAKPVETHLLLSTVARWSPPATA